MGCPTCGSFADANLVAHDAIVCGSVVKTGKEKIIDTRTGDCTQRAEESHSAPSMRDRYFVESSKVYCVEMLRLFLLFSFAILVSWTHSEDHSTFVDRRTVPRGALISLLHRIEFFSHVLDRFNACVSSPGDAMVISTHLATYAIQIVFGYWCGIGWIGVPTNDRIASTA